MRGSLKNAAIIAILALGAPITAHATAIILPTPLTVIGATSISFVYSGTITGTDTLSLTATGGASDGFGHTSQANAAGVITVLSVDIPPNYPFRPYVTDTDANGNNDDALLLSISGVSEQQLFKPTAANGLGSSAPPSSLTLASTSLSSLGFGSFTVTNPTLTFRANVSTASGSGRYIITQDAALTAVPEPRSGWLLLGMLASFPIVLASKRMRGVY